MVDIDDDILDTERLTLEPMMSSHAAALFELLADARLYSFIPRGPPESVTALRERFLRLETRRSPAGDETWLNWAVRRKSDGEYVGRAEVTVRADRSALLAYAIGVAHWRCGFGTEACRRVVLALFGSYAVDRIVAEIDTRNTASIRLVERLGFERGRVTAGAGWFEGEAGDDVTYSLRRPVRPLSA